jgi:hypothetical protein
VAEGLQHVDDFLGRPRQPAQAAAGGHAADEDAGIERQVAHAHAVAEDRAAGERAARVDGHHAHAAAFAAVPRTRASTRVLLPTPGGPVTPRRGAPPSRG